MSHRERSHCPTPGPNVLLSTLPTPQEYLGLDKIIWLWKGVAGDDSVVNGEAAALRVWSFLGLFKACLLD